MIRITRKSISLFVAVLVLLVFTFLYVQYVSVPKQTILSKVKTYRTFNPSTDTSSIPKYLHQTLPSLDSIPITYLYSINTFIRNNPDYEHIIYDDNDIHDFIKEKYPHLADFILNLPQKIMIVDLFRYLVVHYYGGYYSDADTICLKPIKLWNNEHKNAKVILGIEGDTTEFDIGLSRKNTIQLLQWTFGAVGNHSLMSHVIERMIDRIKKQMKSNNNLKKFDAAELTGPGTWTDAISSYLEKKHQIDYKKALVATVIPKIFGDILILPEVGFNAGVDWHVRIGVIGSGTVYNKRAFVRHLEQRSWANYDNEDKGSFPWAFIPLFVLVVMLLWRCRKNINIRKFKSKGNI